MVLKSLSPSPVPIKNDVVFCLTAIAIPFFTLIQYIYVFYQCLLHLQMLLKKQMLQQLTQRLF